MNTLVSRKWKTLSKKGAAVRVIQTTFYHPASARYIPVYQVLTISLTLSPRLPYHFPEVSVPYRNLHFFFFFGCICTANFDNSHARHDGKEF